MEGVSCAGQERQDRQGRQERQGFTGGVLGAVTLVGNTWQRMTCSPVAAGAPGAITRLAEAVSRSVGAIFPIWMGIMAGYSRPSPIASRRDSSTARRAERIFLPHISQTDFASDPRAAV